MESNQIALLGVDRLASPGPCLPIPRSLFMALLERPPPAASCLSSCLLSFSSFLIFSLLFHFFSSHCVLSPYSRYAFIAMYLVLVPPSISPLPPFSFLNSISSSNQCPCLYYNHMIVGLFSSKAALSPWLFLIFLAHSIWTTLQSQIPNFSSF